ncbi:hypothetical protein BC936DRAFT_143322 [Jimgerdemannia flammicorona]|uniref:RBR-type E3 ubiquitin transferase n=1 Tax=Jimgerdemannia flammicorona TaxID=994334 RepID=A0A433DDZ3_9FUNG|nr:hypothetical protein BC936DRAFT_143322 [Jimgerdemannia flammicorona]
MTTSSVGPRHHVCLETTIRPDYHLNKDTSLRIASLCAVCCLFSFSVSLLLFLKECVRLLVVDGRDQIGRQSRVPFSRTEKQSSVSIDKQHFAIWHAPFPQPILVTQTLVTETYTNIMRPFSSPPAPHTPPDSTTTTPPPPPPFQKRTTLLIAFPFPFLPSFLHFLGTPQPQPLSYYTLYFPALRRFSVSNLLLAYSLPFLYLFFPALILPAIFFRSLSFIVAGQRGVGTSGSSGGGLSAWKRGRNGRDLNDDTAEGSDGFEGGAQDIEYWLQRCSICFDAQLDLCLDYCRDQFCRECFRRYITEVVNSSWGLSVTEIHCPVCQDVISQSEWARYVPSSVVERYNAYNQPYRSFTRHCEGCDGEVVACKAAKMYGKERERWVCFDILFAGRIDLFVLFSLRIEMPNMAGQKTEQVALRQYRYLVERWREVPIAAAIPRGMKQIFGNRAICGPIPHYLQSHFKEIYESVKEISFRLQADADPQIPPSTIKSLDSSLRRFDSDYRAHLTSGGSSVSEMYKCLIPSLVEQLGEDEAESEENDRAKRHRMEPVQRRRRRYEFVAMVSDVSAKLVALEGRPEQWKELQFLHVKNFPMANCTACAHELCLQCGVGTHHAGLTCVEYMQRRIDASREPPEVLENVKWKLRNSKSCPNCCVLINRDDGCNKVDCLHCGHRFCWMCRSAWSEKCGFYQCRASGDSLFDDVEIATMIAGDDLDPKAKGVGDRPEIGVPNVLMIQARFNPGAQRA